MKKVGLVFIGVLFYAATGWGQDGRAISELATQANQIDEMEMTATLKIIDARGRERLRTLTTTTGSFDGVTKTRLKFTEPADVRGTALLIYDYEDQADDMWIFLPALRKTRRIVSSEKGKSFMGSEFTNADMALPNLDDFTYRVLGEENYDGHECWMVESACRNEDLEDENGFSKKISWIEKDTYLAYKIAFYNFDGELFKEQIINDYRKDSQGKVFAWYMEMRNLDNGRKSVMQVDQFKSDMQLSESEFTPAMLDQ